MKHFALLLALLGVVPLALVLQNCPNIRQRAWIVFGFLPFLLPAVSQLDVALWGTPDWKGYVQATEVSLIDFLALALLISMPRRRSVLGYHAPLLFYLCTLILAVFQAAHTDEAFFAVFQFARMYLIVVTVTRGAMEESVPLLLMKGFGLGIALQLIVMAIQLRTSAYVQPPGTFAHQNTLGLVLHLVVLPHFALFLAGARSLQFVVVPPLCVLVAALTASRASFGLCLAGLLLTYVLSWLRRGTRRKAIIAVTGLVGIAAIAPLAMSSFERRFSTTPLEENVYDERAAFNRAALSVLADNPWGVGPNHYVHVAKNYGYSLRAGVAPVEGNLNTMVHNAYLLAAVELGYIGFAALLSLLGYSLFVALRYAAVARGQLAGDLLLGAAVAIAIVAVHSGYEFILFGKEAQYIFSISIGIVFGVASSVAARSVAHRGTEHYSPRADFLAGRPAG